jgi:hypothetical protein
VKIAKASEADIEMATELVLTLEALGHRFCPAMPEAIAPVDPKDDFLRIDEPFDKTDDAQCGSALRHLLDIAERGSMGRVVWGMAAVVDPKNNIVDPNADTLEVNPELLRRFDCTPCVAAALRLLYQVCAEMDLENQMDRPTEDQYLDAMMQAQAALQAVDSKGVDPFLGVSALALQAVKAADYYGKVLTVDQVDLQPLAMGHYNTVVHVRHKRVMAEKGGAA